MATPHEATIEAGDLRLSLRCLTVTDIPKLSERFQQENWDESVFYLPQIIQCYPEAFIGAFLGDNDLICSVALLNLTDSEAYLTGFVTEPKHRRLGIGFQLFDKAISFAKGRRVMINSDPKVFEKYERYGFTREFYLHKMSGILTPWKECNTMDASCLPNVVIGHVTEDNIQDICLYDERISGIKRKTFLRMILMASNTITACAFSNCGAVVGLLALCKVDSQQVKMFSFYANDAEIAGLLLREVVSKPTVRGCYLKLFLPEMNPESEKLFRLCGLERDSCGFKLARMNNRDSHTNIPWRSVFCICCSGYFYV